MKVNIVNGDYKNSGTKNTKVKVNIVNEDGTNEKMWNRIVLMKETVDKKKVKLNIVEEDHTMMMK